MDRLIVVSKAIEQKIREEGRFGAPVSLIYNGVDLQRYNHQQPCCTLHEDYRSPRPRRSWAWWRGWRPRRATGR
jgi:hypothetical protein